MLAYGEAKMAIIHITGRYRHAIFELAEWGRWLVSVLTWIVDLFLGVNADRVAIMPSARRYLVRLWSPDILSKCCGPYLEPCAGEQIGL